MSISRGPKTVTNGLVLCLDAADRNSYVSGSSTWIDLSGNNNNGTLTNNPAFNTEVGGCFTFDGINQYINFGDVLDMTTNDISGFVWANVITLKNYTAFIDKLQSGGNYRLHMNSAGTLYFGIRNSAGTYQEVVPTSKIVANTWYYIGFTHNITTKLAIIYLNGQNIGSNTFTIDRGNTGDELKIAYTSNNAVYSNTKQATISLYNRELTATEVLQNYNATKSRFGL